MNTGKILENGVAMPTRLRSNSQLPIEALGQRQVVGVEAGHERRPRQPEGGVQRRREAAAGAPRDAEPGIAEGLEDRGCRVRGCVVDHDHSGQGKEPEAGGERAVAADDLQVQAHEEERAEHAERDRERNGIAGRERGDAEELERHHRFARPLLVLKERDEENHGCDERCDDRRRRPAVLVGFDERVGEAEERAGSQGQSGDVEVSRLLRPRLSDRSQADDETEDERGLHGRECLSGRFLSVCLATGVWREQG